MLRFFDSGALAARAQAVAVLLIWMVLPALAGNSAADVATVPRKFGLSDPELLKWIFLVVSAVVAISYGQSQSRNAARVAKATQLITAGRGKRLQISMLLQLRVATAAMAVLTITPPPDLLLRLLAPLVDVDITALAWAGGMSVGVAYFGADASTARRALRN